MYSIAGLEMVVAFIFNLVLNFYILLLITLHIHSHISLTLNRFHALKPEKKERASKPRH